VADAAEEDFDLHVVCGRIASRDGGEGQWRCCTGSGKSFGLVSRSHALKKTSLRSPSLAERANGLECFDKAVAAGQRKP
jgi:hypothetical protein